MWWVAIKMGWHHTYPCIWEHKGLVVIAAVTLFQSKAEAYFSHKNSQEWPNSVWIKFNVFNFTHLVRNRFLDSLFHRTPSVLSVTSKSLYNIKNHFICIHKHQIYEGVKVDHSGRHYIILCSIHVVKHLNVWCIMHIDISLIYQIIYLKTCSCSFSYLKRNKST